MPRHTAWLAIALAGTAACVGPGSLLAPVTPHAAYVFALRRSGLAESAEARSWLRAADAAVRDAAVVSAPARRRGTLGSSSTDRRALSLRVQVPRGRRLSVAAGFESASTAPLFIDLFRVEGDAPPRRVASMSSRRRTLVHDVEEPGDYVIRAQTELFASGEATVAVRTLASLPSPVAGADARMQSGFGVARDAGRRQHQGIDIFAPRGTPVRAVTGGIARAGSNRLGGTVVWLYAPGEGRTFYYAHLDRHAIGAVAMVATGDVIGYVGNTGNARSTPPHLHFGIYENGAIDPWPFVQPDQPIPRDRPAPARPAQRNRPARSVRPRSRRRPRSGRRRRA